jgi:hypothetical protein
MTVKIVMAINDSEKLFTTMFGHYRKLNNEVGVKNFLANVLTPNIKELVFFKKNFKLYPLVFQQMSMLYNLNKLRYNQYLNDELLYFLGKCFSKNVVFLLNPDGFLHHIFIMQTTITDRQLITSFFANQIKELPTFQYYSQEYDPLLEPFKLLTAKPKDFSKDILLTFY